MSNDYGDAGAAFDAMSPPREMPTKGPFASVPLSQQMLQAAEIIERFNTEYSDIYNLDSAWRPSGLRREAAHREAEEREAGERAAMVEALAKDLHHASYPEPLGPAYTDALANVFRARAALLIDEFHWTRGDFA